MARRQNAGRGRRGRAWDAGQGNLAATLLLTLDKPAIEAAQLAFVAALAVADLAGAHVVAQAVALKWPNDVLVSGRKAAGILIETGAAGAGGLWLAVGIGVNLANFPDDVERPATALAEHGEAPSPEQAMSGLSAAFAYWLDLWLQEGFEPIRAAWTARAWGLGGPCTARLPRETVEGLAQGLDADGALLIRLPGGELRRIAAGDVFFGET